MNIHSKKTPDIAASNKHYGSNSKKPKSSISSNRSMATAFDLRTVVRTNILELTPYRCARDVSYKAYGWLITLWVISFDLMVCLTFMIGLQQRCVVGCKWEQYGTCCHHSWPSRVEPVLCIPLSSVHLIHLFLRLQGCRLLPLTYYCYFSQVSRSPTSWFERRDRKAPQR